MGDRLPYWVAIDFGTDHDIVRCASYPPGSDRYYYTGPFRTFAKAKEHIRTASWMEREGISSKLNYWMGRTVADIPVLDIPTKEDSNG